MCYSYHRRKCAVFCEMHTYVTSQFTCCNVPPGSSLSLSWTAYITLGMWWWWGSAGGGRSQQAKGKKKIVLSFFFLCVEYDETNNVTAFLEISEYCFSFMTKSSGSKVALTCPRLQKKSGLEPGLALFSSSCLHGKISPLCLTLSSSLSFWLFEMVIKGT